MSHVANYIGSGKESTSPNMKTIPSAASRVDRYIAIFISISFFAYCIRDGASSLARFILKKIGLDVLWYVTDLFAFGCFIIFIYMIILKNKNFIGALFLTSFLVSLMISIFFMNDKVFTFVSTIKMFIPMFVGFCFYNKILTDNHYALKLLTFIFFMSAISVALNPYIEYPWYGETVSSFGIEREAARVWWSGGVQRYGGIAGDSTMAGFMVIFTFVMISPYRTVLFNILCWPLIYLALDASNSKTGMGAFILYVIYYCYIQFVPKINRINHLRVWVSLSFVCLFIPPLLMIFLGGVDLVAIDPVLYSLGDRINNTWNGPFLALSDLFPVGLFTGCGIGCYSYPMSYTGMAKFNIPLDNFYLTTFIMMGYPFVIFVALIFRNVSRTLDPTKLVLLMIWNVYTVTVQAYGPSYACLLFGYAVSGVFSPEFLRRSVRGIPWRARRRPFANEVVAAE